MRIALLSNVNLDMLRQPLTASRHDVFETEGYGGWASYALDAHEGLSDFSPECIFLILDGCTLLESCGSEEEGEDELRRAAQAAGALASRYGKGVVAVSTIDFRRRRIAPADRPAPEEHWRRFWDGRLEALAQEHRNLRRFELSALIEDHGRLGMYSDKMWYRASLPYSVKGVSALAAAIDAFAAALTRPRKKVLVTDLDYTLWGGVAGEAGPHGIELGGSLLGAAYRDAQKRMAEISKTGVLLAVASKNNPEDVAAVFRENRQMLLREEDFVAICANWEPKAENIRKMALDLNLGLDSFVFLDDNEVEREAVRMALPEVSVAEFPADPANLPQAVSKLYDDFFWSWSATGEDGARTAQYRQEAKRRQEMSVAASLEEFLLSLNMVIVLDEVRDETFDRVVQLLNKTNQFNTNTLRLDSPALSEYLKRPGRRVYTASLSDRHGDSGLIAVLMLALEGDTAVVENFLMSCRVMGRQVEDAVIACVESRAREGGCVRMAASYAPTAKNKPVERLWDRLGYRLESESGDGGRSYSRSLACEREPLLKAHWRLP